MKASPGERIFYTLNEIFLVIVGVLCFAPLLHVAAVSFSNNSVVAAGQVFFWPVRPTTFAYEYIMQNEMFWKGMVNSIARTLLGTAVNLVFTVLIAYPLSKSVSRFKHRTMFAWFFFIPMIVNGGLIPNYILINQLKMIDRIWALVLPSGVPIFYILVMLNFFRDLPVEIEESALIDGAGQWRILLQLYIPLSTPALATITVFAVIGHWNSWFDGLIYMNDPKNYPLMTYLQTAVLNIDWDNLTASEAAQMSKLGDRTYKSAQMFLGCLPVLLTYPFLQKYFVKGLVLGGVKG